MERGKRKCEVLRNLRKEVAERYDLQYEPAECHHEGDCPGTCPVCDAELRDLQRQLAAKGIDDILPSEENVEMGYDQIDEPMFEAGIPAPPYVDDILQGDVVSPETLLYRRLERIFLKTQIAGLTYHDALDVWDELYEGIELSLVREHGNRYDADAVAIVYIDDDNDGVRQEYKLGYIPKDCNATVAALMDAGWADLLRCEITSMADRKRHMEVNIEIILKNRQEVSSDFAKPGLRYLVMDKEEHECIVAELRKTGTCHFRWGGFPPWELNLPDEGDKVLFISKHMRYNELYLMLVIGRGDSAIPFLEDKSEVDWVDDCSPYVLSCIKGPIKVDPNNFFEEHDIDEDQDQPDVYMTPDASDKIMKLFNLNE